MPQTENLRIPSYRRHRPSGQAVVTVQQKDHYLGPWRRRTSVMGKGQRSSGAGRPHHTASALSLQLACVSTSERFACSLSWAAPGRR